jgi:hypothetical protein
MGSGAFIVAILYEHKMGMGCFICNENNMRYEYLQRLIYMSERSITVFSMSTFEWNLSMFPMVVEGYTWQMDVFEGFFLQQLFSSFEKGNHLAYLEQLKYFMSYSCSFSPAAFEYAYNELDFSSAMNYKSFLQKLSTQHYEAAVIHLLEGDLSRRQVIPFCKADTSLKQLMWQLASENWGLSKYMLGEYVIVANGPNLEMHQVYHERIAVVMDMYQKFIDRLNLHNHDDYVMNNRCMYWNVDMMNIQIVQDNLPKWLESTINDMYIMLDDKKTYIRDITIVCFCSRIPNTIGHLNLRLGTKCVFGNGKDLMYSYH